MLRKKQFIVNNIKRGKGGGGISKEQEDKQDK